MSLISLVVVLVLIGIGLYLLNTYGGSIIDGKILKIINIVVLIAVVLICLYAFGILPLRGGGPMVPQVR